LRVNRPVLEIHPNSKTLLDSIRKLCSWGTSVFGRQTIQFLVLALNLLHGFRQLSFRGLQKLLE